MGASVPPNSVDGVDCDSEANLEVIVAFNCLCPPPNVEHGLTPLIDQLIVNYHENPFRSWNQNVENGMGVLLFSIQWCLWYSEELPQSSF